jgi:hypothetical protein
MDENYAPGFDPRNLDNDEVIEDDTVDEDELFDDEEIEILLDREPELV